MYLVAHQLPALSSEYCCICFSLWDFEPHDLFEFGAVKMGWDMHLILWGGRKSTGFYLSTFSMYRFVGNKTALRTAAKF